MIFAKFKDFTEPQNNEQDIKELLHENEMLKNRCLALTQGEMCKYCPYKCENRTTKYKGDK